MGFLWETSSSVGNRHCKADDEHRKCQQLSPRKGSQVEPDVRIGLAHKLHQKTEQSVKSDEAPEYGAGIEILPAKPAQDEEQHQALQQRFVNLRGMSRDAAPFWKDHSPRKTPMNPPWKDIPPCHIAKMESGSRR